MRGRSACRTASVPDTRAASLSVRIGRELAAGGDVRSSKEQRIFSPRPVRAAQVRPSARLSRTAAMSRGFAVGASAFASTPGALHSERTVRRASRADAETGRAVKPRGRSSDGSIRRGVRQDAPETREAVPPSRRNESCRCHAAQIEHASTLSGRSPSSVRLPSLCVYRPVGRRTRGVAIMVALLLEPAVGRGPSRPPVPRDALAPAARNRRVQPQAIIATLWSSSAGLSAQCRWETDFRRRA